MIRIGLTPQDFLAWQGGRELFQLIATALRERLAPPNRIMLVPSAGQGGVANAAKRILKRRRKPSSADLAPLGLDLPIADAGTEAFDVLGPFVTPPRGLRAPFVGYIPDLQHRRLPGFFSLRERAARDRIFSGLLARAAVILVNSAEVARDIALFYPEAGADIAALPFAACPEPGWLAGEPDAAERYGIAGPFFLCSNQFWLHKNHQLLLAAMAMARREGAPVKVAFTGHPGDYRRSGHYAGLLAEIEGGGIAADAHLLGFIPKADQIALMRQAVAVVQPSLFEGGPGGGAVYNAIALGRPTIVSDLPVNREIAPLITAFFDPLDPADLLRQLRAVQALEWAQSAPAALLEAGEARRRAFGEALGRAFLAAAGQRKEGSVRTSSA